MRVKWNYDILDPLFEASEYKNKNYFKKVIRDLMKILDVKRE